MKGLWLWYSIGAARSERTPVAAMMLTRSGMPASVQRLAEARLQIKFAQTPCYPRTAKRGQSQQKRCEPNRDFGTQIECDLWDGAKLPQEMCLVAYVFDSR